MRSTDEWSSQVYSVCSSWLNLDQRPHLTGLFIRLTCFILENHFKEIDLQNSCKNFFWNKSLQTKAAKLFLFPKNLWGSAIHGNKDNYFIPASDWSINFPDVSQINYSIHVSFERRCWRGRRQACSGSCAWWKMNGHESPGHSILIFWIPSLVVLFVFQGISLLKCEFSLTYPGSLVTKKLGKAMSQLGWTAFLYNCNRL